MSAVRKAVIPLAGHGTRLYPASWAIAKGMFPLVDRDGITKTVIQIIVEEAIDSGIEEVCLIVRPGEEQKYRSYFRQLEPRERQVFRGKDWALLESEKLAKLGQRLRFAEQSSAEGFGHAVLQAKSFAADNAFLVMLGDHVYISETKDRCARQVIDAFESGECDAVSGVRISSEQELHLFGTIRGEEIDAQRGVYRATRIVEKPSIDLAQRELATANLPAGNYLCHFGLHVFSAAIFDALDYLVRNDLRERGEIQLTAAQELLRVKHDRYRAVVVRGQRYDTGVPYGLIEAQLALGLNGVHRVEMARILAVQIRD